MSNHSDPLTAEGILAALDSQASKITLQIFDHIDSTNLHARHIAAKGAAEGAIIVAGSQSAGRGRLGRSFYSPEGTGLYMSILLRPSIAPSSAILITTAAAVAVCDAISEVFGKEAQIKWVNDIFLAGKKVCGILTEAAFSAQGDALEYAVCGIGINICPPENGFPPELSLIAGALCEQPEAGLRNRIAGVTLKHFFRYYHALEQREFLQEYRRRSLVIGRDIYILRGDQRIPATVLAIDDECRLCVRLKDGSTEIISTGEISIRLKTSE